MKYHITIKRGTTTLLETEVEAPSILIAVHGVTNILSMLDDPTELIITQVPTPLTPSA